VAVTVEAEPWLWPLSDSGRAPSRHGEVWSNAGEYCIWTSTVQWANTSEGKLGPDERRVSRVEKDALLFDDRKEFMNANLRKKARVDAADERLNQDGLTLTVKRWIDMIGASLNS
jgi:hypothetical protein